MISSTSAHFSGFLTLLLFRCKAITW